MHTISKIPNGRRLEVFIGRDIVDTVDFFGAGAFADAKAAGVRAERAVVRCGFDAARYVSTANVSLTFSYN